MQKLVIIIIAFCFQFGSLLSQKDSTKKSVKTRTFFIGTNATLVLYKAYHPPFSNAPANENVPPTYLGPTFSYYRNKIKNKHYMFQSGVEYTYARYYKAHITDGNGKYADHYTSMKMVVNTITIPAYFNLLLYNQKLYFGLGPNFDIIPYTMGSGYISNTTKDKVKFQSFESHFFDFGGTAKIGLNLKLNKGTLTIETRLKSGIRYLLTDGSELVNEYCSLSTGYTF